MEQRLIPIIANSKLTPLNLGLPLFACWDAEYSNTIVRNSSGLVSSWIDIVGAYNLTQGTGSAKPSYNNLAFNNRPGLIFDGSNTFLNLTGVPSTFPINGDPCEIWVLCSQVNLAGSDSTQRRIFQYGGASSTTNSRGVCRAVTGGVNNAFAFAADGASKTKINTNVDFTGRHLVRGIITGSTVGCDVDGISGGSLTATSTLGTTNTRVRMGADTVTTPTLFHNGVINIVLLTNLLSDNQASRLYTYLNKRM